MTATQTHEHAQEMVSEWCGFEAWLTENDRAGRTVLGYKHDLEAFAEWFEQSNGFALRVEDVTPADVREYRNWLQAVKRYSPATIRRRLMALRAYFRWGVEMGRIERDPSARIKPPAEERLSPAWLTRQEQNRLVREAERQIMSASTAKRRRQATRNRALLIFLLHTGLRVSEASALTLADVQMGERSGWVQVRGKGNKARRVPLNADARQALRAWLDVRGEMGISLFGLSVRRMQSALARLGERAGVSLYPHALRHTLAKNLVDAGVGLHTVAALLGHESLNTTRMYVTPGKRDLERAISVLEER